jgi:hypothetical protein
MVSDANAIAMRNQYSKVMLESSPVKEGAKMSEFHMGDKGTELLESYLLRDEPYFCATGACKRRRTRDPYTIAEREIQMYEYCLTFGYQPVTEPQRIFDDINYLKAAINDLPQPGSVDGARASIRRKINMLGRLEVACEGFLSHRLSTDTPKPNRLVARRDYLERQEAATV